MLHEGSQNCDEMIEVDDGYCNWVKHRQTESAGSSRQPPVPDQKKVWLSLASHGSTDTRLGGRKTIPCLTEDFARRPIAQSANSAARTGSS
ncbi:MAG: hypothetical protein ACK557_11950, partial [Planctomycetota bacterium]